MFMVLPSFVVTFSTLDDESRADINETIVVWRVNTEENLEALCKTLRLNGITSYQVVQEPYPWQVVS